MRNLTAHAIALLVAGPAVTCAQSPQDLKAMLDSNRVFALRDSVKGSRASAFYRGAVEESENRTEAAMKDLEEVIRENPNADESFEAHLMIANMDFRNGRSHDAFAQAAAAHAIKPDSGDLINMLPLFKALGDSQDMEVVHRQHSRFQMKRDSDGSRSLPVTIDGRAVSYGFDTGTALSLMGRSDAEMLGLKVQHVQTDLTEASGSAVHGFDIAFATDLVIAGLHLRSVPFFVLQDTGEPFVNVPIGRRGLIGLPVLIAMQSIRWEPDGRVEIGGVSRGKEPILENMLFHGTTAVVQVRVEGKALMFSLDTGATDTDLNEGFAKALPDLVQAGTKETRPITGIGGSVSYDSVLLGPVKFDVGGEIITLGAPHVFPKHSLGKFDGNLGNDILRQARSVSLNFKTMSLALE